MIVDLTNLKYNIEKVKAYTNKELMIVVKDNMYGLGAKYLIPYLKKLKVKFFFVNCYDEYQNLEEELKDVKTLIHHSTTYHGDQIIYSINSLKDAYYFVNLKKSCEVHLNIDLGMNRLGINNLDDYLKIIRLIKRNPHLLLTGIYCHVGLDGFNDLIIEKVKIFNKLTKIYNFKYIHFSSSQNLNIDVGNMVRCLSCIIGYSKVLTGLKFIFYGYIKPLKVFKVNKGDYVGYHNLVKQDHLVALIKIGYYEYPTLKYLVYHHHKYEVIGINCMNHSHLYVDDQINKHTYLSLFSFNDIINDERISFYQFISSLKAMKKGYIKRYQSDIFKVFKKVSKRSYRFRLRRTSNQIISTRIIRI